MTEPADLSGCCRSVTPEQWDQYSQYNRDRAEAEMKAAAELREATALTIAQVSNLDSR